VGYVIERGGMTFRNLSAVSAWVQTFKDKDLYCHCVDMATLIMLCTEAYETIAEGIREDVVAELILMVNPLYRIMSVCYAKLRLVLGSEVCPKYLMGLAQVG
jgi:hypothetical protein